MLNEDKRLRLLAEEEVEKNKALVEKDPYRLHYHVMPPVGLLNDPNGFIQWNGIYHLFYQWMPFKTGHGAKFWGHISSKDLVHWEEQPIALTPSEWFEKNGCYSGSAIEHNGKLYLFYTGNVKDEDRNRQTYQCLAISEDGIDFSKKGPIVHLPDEYTAHFRDPKVWQQNGAYFMVIGAQTTELNGAVALLRSENLTDWTHMGILAGGGKGSLGQFGHMFECPDLFNLNGKDILIFSPQGLSAQGFKYQNAYQSGYVVGTFDPETTSFQHGPFDELDRGFDFYAPQTTLDQKGRRILFAWMAVPDQNEQEHPTIPYKWLHNMTLPRELKLIDGKIYQKPVKELEQLRGGLPDSHHLELVQETINLTGVHGKKLELMIDQINVVKGSFYITIGGTARLIYSKEDRIFTLERQSYADGLTEKRQCYVEALASLQIFIDTSSIEVFINGGEETFTARFYPSLLDDSILFGASSKSQATVLKWTLANQ
ncbi:glycoside hydrolase family 32 protein [Bacillus sp. SD088]|uniref:glycoside hydrolase family 32 protein n=1 Tax=Bacillus sp. SD088 TaxID=2782012 RepID=UPI001A976F14|nr:sucrose-6-phosphate hydrolase [Bacillus sp. SD088]MBO0995478.1 sucrose-6-phosphate hydrolase [Bacillus sp. SD088]